MTPRLLRIALVVAVALAGTEFVVRGPLRFLRHGQERSTDLAGPYLGARAFVRGLNPYSSRVFWDMADEVGWGAGRTDQEDDFESRSPYPVTTFVLLAPLARAGWPVARVCAAVVVGLLVVVAIGVLSRLQDEPGVSAGWRRWLFLAVALALAPLHSALGTGNLVAAAVAFTAVGAWALVTGRDQLAGVSLALAACIKPPIAAPVLGYALLRGRWRTVTASVAVAAVLIGVAAVRLAGTPWVSGYLANNTLLLAGSGVDIIKWSEAQQQFINLQYLGYYVFSSAATVSRVSLLVGGVLVAAWAVLLWRHRRSPLSLLEMSAAAVISLLPIYHRVYDAALLVLPLAWALAAGRKATRGHRALTLLLLAPFLVPGGTWLEQQVHAGAVPEWLTAQWWWSVVVLPHQVWALLAMSLVLLRAQAVEGRTA